MCFIQIEAEYYIETLRYNFDSLIFVIFHIWTVFLHVYSSSEIVKQYETEHML